ncbi:MAG TPA: hypothetical protein VE820_08990, partial [Sphingomicrobium sp.]|nr:hypothetical protein [Sphingomicrobium sp.]
RRIAAHRRAGRAAPPSPASGPTQFYRPTDGLVLPALGQGEIKVSPYDGTPTGILNPKRFRHQTAPAEEIP